MSISKFLQTYPSKLMLTVFLGIQIPLLSLVLYSGMSPSLSTESSYPGLWVFGLSNVIATVITQYIVYHLFLSTTSRMGTSTLPSENLAIIADQEIGTLITDTSDTLERLDDIIQNLTNYDPLTGLPNRELFQDYLQQAISEAGTEQQFALIVLNVDSLGEVNSSLGRQAGDILLTSVAQRLQACIYSQDILARFGGDEFMVLRPNLLDPNDLITLSHNLLQTFVEPFSLWGKSICCAAKIGITIYPWDGTAVEQLLSNAETAVNQAKSQRFTTFQFYSAAMKISVNLSPGQFKQTNLIETIEGILQDTKIDRTYLELEITESLLVEDIEMAIAILRELKQRGISIALDDFGTGYSSLSYLQQLPLDTLKIDRAFVTNIASNPGDAAISNAIMALAQSLSLKIAAEGVETQEQFNYLQDQGCDEIQGYYVSKPLSPEMLQNFLQDYY